MNGLPSTSSPTAAADGGSDDWATAEPAAPAEVIWEGDLPPQLLLRLWLVLLCSLGLLCKVNIAAARDTASGDDGGGGDECESGDDGVPWR
jgi:hypothetical protein